MATIFALVGTCTRELETIIIILSLTHTQMGYDGLFFWRNDYDDRNNRLKDNLMEMVWRPSPSLGQKSDLFTGILFYGYGPPPGFCYDMKCTDPPIQVDCCRRMNSYLKCGAVATSLAMSNLKKSHELNCSQS